jgi:hypothetical protein
MTGKPDPILRQVIQMGCPEFILAIATQVTVTEVVGQNVYDIRFINLFASITGLTATRYDKSNNCCGPYEHILLHRMWIKYSTPS